MRLVFATHNTGKLAEMRELLNGIDIEVLSAEEACVHEEPVEDGETFEENALKKARFVAEKTGEWAVADDSGICIQALGGKPGVNSRRWAGEDVSDTKLAQFTLEKMRHVSEGERDAWFESAVVLVSPDGKHWTFGGVIQGTLSMELRGKALPNLPYDLIFIPEGHARTFAEMPAEEKNSMSHRGQAFLELKKFLALQKP